MEMKPTPPEVLAWLKSEGHKGASAHRDRLGAVTRAYKDRPPLIPALDEKGLIYEQMTKPTPMLKFGRSGAPHWRIFQVPLDSFFSCSLLKLGPKVSFKYISASHIRHFAMLVLLSFFLSLSLSSQYPRFNYTSRRRLN
jgi:hypothetical protein